MKNNLVILVLFAFLAACAPAASEPDPTPTPAAGFTQPQWGSGFQQPQWGNNGWNESQSSEEQASNEAITVESQDEAKDPTGMPRLNWWLLACVLEFGMGLAALTFGVTRLIAKIRKTRTFIDYPLWLQVVIPLVVILASLAFGFLLWKRTGGAGQDFSWAIDLPYSFFAWAWVIFLIARAILSFLKRHDEEAKNFLRVMEDDLLEKMNLLADVEEKLEKAKGTRASLLNNQASRLGEEINAVGSEIDRIKDRNQTRPADIVSNLPDLEETDPMVVNILEALMAPWMRTFGMLSRRIRGYNFKVTFPAWMWAISIGLPLTAAVFLINPVETALWTIGSITGLYVLVVIFFPGAGKFAEIVIWLFKHVVFFSWEKLSSEMGTMSALKKVEAQKSAKKS